MAAKLISELTLDTPVIGDLLPFYDSSGSDTNQNTIGYVVDAGVTQLGSGTALGWSSSANPGGAAADTTLSRLAAGVVGTTWIKQSCNTRVSGNVTNSTATMANITGLSVTLIAGRKYAGSLVLFAADSVGGEGIKFDFDGGTATATSFQSCMAAHPIYTGLEVVTATAISSSTLAGDISYSDVPTSLACYKIEFSIVCNAGGTFIPRFAQNSHTSGTATVYLGSNMIINDIV